MQAPNSTPSVSIEVFTRQEKKVMCFMLEGLSSEEIAAKLDVCGLTIKTHKQNIARKAEVKGASALRKFVISMADILKNTPFLLLFYSFNTPLGVLRGIFQGCNFASLKKLSTRFIVYNVIKTPTKLH